MRECKGLYAFLCDYFLNLEKISGSLTALRYPSLLHIEVVLRDIDSIEYFAQITQDTDTDVLLYSCFLNLSVDE